MIRSMFLELNEVMVVFLGFTLMSSNKNNIKETRVNLKSKNELKIFLIQKPLMLFKFQ